MFDTRELELIRWMLGTATENNPQDAELKALDEKVHAALSE